MEPPTALDLYQLHAQVRAMELALRELAQVEGGTSGQWGAVRFLGDACYYLFGAAGWLIQDMTSNDRRQLELQLESLP